MRGTLNDNGLFLLFPRLTPAHAGRTKTVPIGPSKRRVHPRLCGEHFSGMWVPICNAAQPRLCGEDRSYENTSLFKEGSPPTMRGTQRRLSDGKDNSGFTPAHAGNTLAETAISSQNTKNFDSHTLQLLLQRNTADLQHRNTSSPKLTHSDQYTTTYIKRASTALIPRGRNPPT